MERIRVWEHKLDDDWKGKRAVTYKWVRDDFHPRAAFMKLESGDLTGNVTAMQAESKRVWTSQVYCNPDRRPVDRPRVRGKYAPLLQTRRAPHVLAPLRGVDLKATASSWPRAKKGGTDGWEASHFKGAPMEFMDWLADLLNLIEEGAPWPESMLHSRTAYLEKDPEDCLNPLAYRVLPIMPVGHGQAESVGTMG